MTRLRVALLNAAHDGFDTRRNFRREVAADLVEYHVPAGELPETVAFDACIVTGSRASVYWDRPWIGELKSWVGDAIQRGVPCLGVCFGHQLLADVLGGQVEDMGEYEIGYRTVQQSGESLLFEGIDTEFTVFTTHSDRVARLPPGADLIAEYDYGIHGFQKDHVFAVQFHPEYDMAAAERVTRAKEGELDEERLTDVLSTITETEYSAACEAKTLFDNFIQYVRDRSETACAETERAETERPTLSQTGRND